MSVLVRKVYGVAGAGPARAGAQPALRMAIGRLGLAAHRRRPRGCLPARARVRRDPAALRAEIQARLDAVRSPFRTAERFIVEEIIDPRDTRPLLCDWAARAHELAAHDLAEGPRSRGLRP